MLGKLSELPAMKSASAGPLPIPRDMSDWTIGTSVRVAKYMNAPKTDAKRVEPSLLPPRSDSTKLCGSALEMIPAAKTPKKR